MGLDTVELLMAFEARFGIEISDAEAAELTTPRKVADYIASRIANNELTREQIAAIVRQVIEEQTATYDFSDDDHFVRDMNLD